jgi:hypothetical protein
MRFGGTAWALVLPFLGGACAAQASGGPCGVVECSGHGVCFTAVNTPYCICADGYHPEGLSCISDVPGDPCHGVDCAGHGTCDDSSGAARCDCDANYTPSGLNCVPLSCGPVWEKSFPGTTLTGLASEPGADVVYALGNAGTMAVLLELDPCGATIRQQTVSTPMDNSWAAASVLVFDGATLHVFGSYEPWDPSVPGGVGALRAALDRNSLEVLETRTMPLADGWTTSYFSAVEEAPDGTWWYAGAVGRNDGTTWSYQSQLVREDPAGTFCVGDPAADPDYATADDVVLVDGRMWVVGMNNVDGFLRSFQPTGTPADPDCIGPAVDDVPLTPPGIEMFMALGLVPQGDGFLLVGESGTLADGAAARALWSPTTGWTVPEAWNPTPQFDRFYRVRLAAGVTVCAAGSAQYNVEYPALPDGIVACYDTDTLAERFHKLWPAAGGCNDLAFDGNGGLWVSCTGFVDSVLRRCRLSTGECP